MESTIILKTDALNALVAAHRLMQEMSSRSQSSVESIHFERGFSAALSTIATVFGLDLEIGAGSASPGADWRIADERALSIFDSQTDALDWPSIPSSASGIGAAGRR
jgi:hypothetical protein